MVKENSKHVVCIVSPNKAAYSETFIQAHIDRLPAKIIALYGYPIPNQTGNGEYIGNTSGFNFRIQRKIDKWKGGNSDQKLREGILHRYLSSNSVRAIMAEYGHTGVALMEVCKNVGIPLIVHFHGHDAYSQKILGNEGQSYPDLFRIASALVVVSHDMQSQLVKLGAPSEKIFVNPYGVEISQFAGANPENSEPIFISVGRFVDKKAPHLTIMAFNFMLKSHPEARLIMIGDGPLLEACKQLAQALEITNSIEFRGACGHDQVAGELRSARAFVQHSLKTSYGDSEGTPVAVLEASAAGLPVVATRHAGIKDVIVDGESGFLVEERDINGMAQAMGHLAKDPVFAGRFGKSGQERVKRDYSIEKSIDNLWGIIRNSIGEG